MSLKLKNNITCKLFAKKPPIKLLNIVSVNRGDGSGIGPTEYIGAVSPNVHYMIKPRSNIQGIMLHSSRLKFNHQRSRKRHHVVYDPFIGNPKWIFDSTSSKSDANVFGASGVVHFNRTSALQIPFVNALDIIPQLYRDFKVELIPFGSVLPPMKHPTYFVTYELNDTFVNKYVHHKKGPGIFIEHHKFTHYLTPATPTSHGPIVIGKLMNQSNKSGKMKLIGVDVPYGYTLVIPGGCLHNDWYFTGKLSTTITTDDQAQTVFVQGRDSRKLAMEFIRKFK
jgi:hypothetical protein